MEPKAPLLGLPKPFRIIPIDAIGALAAPNQYNPLAPKLRKSPYGPLGPFRVPKSPQLKESGIRGGGLFEPLGNRRFVRVFCDALGVVCLGTSLKRAPSACLLSAAEVSHESC